MLLMPFAEVMDNVKVQLGILSQAAVDFQVN
jgi:hypothetical protein